MTVDRAPAANPRRLTCTVDAAHEGATVEDVLRQQLGLTHRAVSRAKFINPGITLDGQRVRVRTRVHAGQTVAAIVSDAAARATTSRVVPERGPLAITYEDEDLLVLDKPPRLAVHPSPGHQTGTLGNYAVAHLIDQGLPPVLHAVHRLDLETSGLVVLAKNAPAQHRLTEQLHTQGFSRVYLAICDGVPEPCQGEVDAPIKQERPGAKRRIVSEDGKPALTRYEVMGSGTLPDGREVALIRCRLMTGRTHQIRVHLASIGHGLLGDELYGVPVKQIDRTALHSWQLSLSHPITGERLELESPLPADMRRLLEMAGIKAGR